METVTVRELRNHGGAVLDRVARGERLVVTRDGVDVAELLPIRRSGVSTAELIARRMSLPHIDLQLFRAEIDEFLDPEL